MSSSPNTSQRLKSVEINSSFYAAPKPSAVKGWAEKTGEDFRFSFKAPQLITHILKLGEGSSDAAGKLSKTLDLLGPRRGPILFQLPPYSKQMDLELLGGFPAPRLRDRGAGSSSSGASRGSRAPHFQLLDGHGAGFCIAENEDMGPTFQVDGRVRLFQAAERLLPHEGHRPVGEEIGEASKGSAACYVYLRHDETGENAILAERLSKLKSAKD